MLNLQNNNFSNSTIFPVSENFSFNFANSEKFLTSFDKLNEQFSYGSQSLPNYKFKASIDIDKANDKLSSFFKALEIDPMVMDNIRSFNSEKANITTLTTNGFTQRTSFLNYIYPEGRELEDLTWLQEVDRSIGQPNAISIIPEGISVSYLIKNPEGNPIAIFKPDDEIGGKTNIKQLDVKMTEEQKSEAAKKEIAARLVGGDFCGVPPVQFVKLIMHGKLKEGSLQKFVPNDGTVSTYLEERRKISAKTQDYTSERKLWRLQKAENEVFFEFCDKVNTDIQRIGILDLLIQNPDRANPANMLVIYSDQKVKLVPIDHNLAFSNQLSPMSFSAFWMYSPYSAIPFDAATLEFVNKLDIEKLSRKMRAIGLDVDRIKNFKILAMFVKKCVEAELTLLEITMIATSEKLFHSPSELSSIVEEIKSSLINESDDQEFFDKFSSELDKLIVEKKNEKNIDGFTNAAKNIMPMLKKETYQSYEVWQKETANFKKIIL